MSDRHSLIAIQLAKLNDDHKISFQYIYIKNERLDRSGCVAVPAARIVGDRRERPASGCPRDATVAGPLRKFCLDKDRLEYETLM